MKKNCVIIIVRYPEFINEFLTSVFGQFNNDFDVVLFDKFGSEIDEELKPKVTIFDTINNSNDALLEAFEFIRQSNYQKVWFLKDDILFDKSTLDNLLKNKDDTHSFVASVLLNHTGDKVVKAFSASDSDGLDDFNPDNSYSVSDVSMYSALIDADVFRNPIFVKQAVKYSGKGNYLKLVSTIYGDGIIVGDSKVYKRDEDVEVVQKEDPLVCAVVVTYNRKLVLRECLEGIIKQNYLNLHILIVDNASTDGTYEYIADMLSDDVFYIRSEMNIGGSGGFYYGMKWAYEHGYDLIWIMDDDVIPAYDALKNLVIASRRVPDASFYGSCVYATNGTAMNTPEISSFTTNGYKFWYKWLKFGMVRLAHATFVSLLFRRETLEKCGLPCKDYFIWGDDTEYTMRVIGNYNPAYIVGNSRVVHKREIREALSIEKETNINRIRFHYYLVRNTLTNASYYSGRKKVNEWINKYRGTANRISKSNAEFADLKVETIERAINDFQTRNYNVRAFDNRFDFYGQEEIRADVLGDESVYNLLKDKCFTSVNHFYSTYSLINLNETFPYQLKDLDCSDVDLPINIIAELKNDKFDSLKSNYRNYQYLFINLKTMITNSYIFDFGSYQANLCLNNNEIDLLRQSNIVPDFKVEKKEYDESDYPFLKQKIDEFVAKIITLYGRERIIVVSEPNEDLSEKERAVLTECHNHLLKKLDGCLTIDTNNISDWLELSRLMGIRK